MKTIDLNAPLAELVTERPDLARTFDYLGLDYCCGGGQTLVSACLAAELDVEEVVARLVESSAGADDDWVSLDPPGLVDHLEQTHHVYLGEALPHLAALFTHVIEAHGERHPELHDVHATFGELRRDIEPHLLKEEQVLFPMIRELFESRGAPTFYCGSLQNPIGVMCLEHDKVGELLARLRAQTAAYVTPGDVCARYGALYAALAELEADTHLHIHKENNVLFPAVAAEELRQTSQ